MQRNARVITEEPVLISTKNFIQQCIDEIMNLRKRYPLQAHAETTGNAIKYYANQLLSHLLFAEQLSDARDQEVSDLYSMIGHIFEKEQLEALFIDMPRLLFQFDCQLNDFYQICLAQLNPAQVKQLSSAKEACVVDEGEAQQQALFAIIAEGEREAAKRAMREAAPVPIGLPLPPVQFTQAEIQHLSETLAKEEQQAATAFMQISPLLPHQTWAGLYPPHLPLAQPEERTQLFDNAPSILPQM